MKQKIKLILFIMGCVGMVLFALGATIILFSGMNIKGIAVGLPFLGVGIILAALGFSFLFP